MLYRRNDALHSSAEAPRVHQVGDCRHPEPQFRLLHTLSTCPELGIDLLAVMPYLPRRLQGKPLEKAGRKTSGR